MISFVNKYALMFSIGISCLLSLLVYILYDSNKTLSNDIVRLEIVKEGLEISRVGLEKEIVNQQKLNKQLQEINIDYRKQIEIFDKHNFEKLSIEKPVLMERRVNNATSEIIKRIACASGSTDRLCDKN